MLDFFSLYCWVTHWPKVFPDGFTDKVKEDAGGVKDTQRSDGGDVGGEDVTCVHAYNRRPSHESVSSDLEQ